MKNNHFDIIKELRDELQGFMYLVDDDCHEVAVKVCERMDKKLRELEDMFKEK